MNPILRLVRPEDNAAIFNIVCTVLEEFGCTGAGWASGDAELKDMYRAYDKPGAQYWVVEDTDTGEVLGGGGFSQLKGTTAEEGVCELQKLYFLPKTRGLGLGKKLLSLLIQEAGRAGYRTMYLESVPQLDKAVGLYIQLGFVSICENLGNTGHQNNCSVYMTRSLEAEVATCRQPD